MGLFDAINPQNFYNPLGGTQGKSGDILNTWLTKDVGKLFGVGGGGIGGAGVSDLSQVASNPLIDSLKTQVSGMQAPKQLGAGDIGTAYAAHDYTNEALPEFESMRNRLNSQYSQAQGQAQDAIDRQFAAAGGGPGNGAQAKQTENLAAQTEKQKGEDIQGINAQEAQAKRALNETEKQRAYESGEAVKGRQFQAGEFNAQSVMQNEQFKFSANSTIAGLDQGWREAQAEASNNEFNRQLAEFQAKHSGGLLGGGGFLGTGFGSGF